MTPIEGQKATFYPSQGEPIADAFITKVWSDTCVNLEYMDGETVVSPSSVYVWVEGTDKPSGYYCVLHAAAADNPPPSEPNTEHEPKLLTDADAAADLAGEPRPDSPTPPPVSNEFVAPGAELFADEPAPLGIYSLELARALPEVGMQVEAVVFTSDDPLHVTKFGSADQLRLMQIVHVAGCGLAAQEVAPPEVEA